MIFEDGFQLRDLVHVNDIVRANLACMETSKVQYGCYNVGSGEPTSILGLARSLKEGLGSRVEPVITNKYRTGDIRSCYANISRIRKEIGFEPTIKLSDGITDLIRWVAGQTPTEEIGDAMKELIEKKLAG
jgi:dTDP-L-rhamnose 4-epimerase